MGGLPSASPVRNGNNFKLYANAPPSNCLFERMGGLEGGALGAEFVMMHKRRHDHGKTVVHRTAPHRRGQDLPLPCELCLSAQLEAHGPPRSNIRRGTALVQVQVRMSPISVFCPYFSSLIESVIFKDDVAVERHTPFPYYSTPSSSLNDILRV